MYLRTKICENQKKCLFLHRFSTQGPFVYRLGRKIFILERGVRFSYGLQIKEKATNIQKWQTTNHHSKEFGRPNRAVCATAIMQRQHATQSAVCAR